MQIRGIFIMGLAALIIVSCLEPYYPDATDYVDRPVITGIVTDDPGPYFVRLTHSTAILDMEIKPIRWAVVKISDDAGNDETLTEISPGLYATRENGIRGVEGRSYMISVEADGRTYRSNYELLRPSVPIDSIYALPEKEPLINGYVDGLQFYLNTDPVTDPNTKLLWTLKETFKFRSEYELDFIYYRPDSIVTNYSDTGLVCWRTERPAETYSYAFTSSTENKLSGFPLHFVNTLTDKLTERYSVEVYQHTISDEAYTYWSEIQKLHQESGSLYSRQPYQVKGNLYDTEDPDAVVLGYFVAAGVAKKRIFVDRPPFIFNYEVCNYVVNLLQTMPVKDIRFPVYAMELDGNNRGFANISCFDCRRKGGTIVEPDFWEE